MSNARKAALKEDFIARRGYWGGFWDGLLDFDPDFFSAYLDYSAIPWESGPLSPKVKEFLYIAIDAATTHLYAPGLSAHLENALRYGATRAEIMEVLRVTASMGIQTMLRGSRILAEEMGVDMPAEEINGVPRTDASPAPELRAAYEAAFGDWTAECDAWVYLAPDSLAAAVRAWGCGIESPLDAKTRAFILVAINAAVTHLDERAMRLHVRMALANGALRDEIVEVLQLASVLGMHSCTVGVPALVAAGQR